MKKTRQRIAKVLATFVTVCVAAVPTFAATIGDTGVYQGSDTVVAIGKDLVIYNDGYSKSYSPSITYLFSIAPATVAAGASVTDSNGTEMEVKAGIADAVSGSVEKEAADDPVISSVVFNSEEAVDTGDTLSMAIRKEMAFEFDMTKFTAPGIYRYVITDVTPTASLLAAGIVRPADYEDTKNLDVYVVRSTSASGGYEIAGYVLTDTTVSTQITPDTDKDPGFRSSVTTVTEIPVPGSEIPDTQDETVTPGTTGVEGDNAFDYYYTYNVEITKHIDGNMADTTHAFPFAVEIGVPNGATVGTMVYAGTDAADLTASNGASALSTALSNNDVYYVYGVNPLATVNIAEQNDTGNSYVLTTSDGTYQGEVAEDTIAPGEWMSDDKPVDITVSNYNMTAAAVPGSIAGNANNAITFTNTFDAGTPTGFLMRVAPFAAILGLAGALFAVSRIKTKKSED